MNAKILTALIAVSGLAMSANAQYVGDFETASNGGYLPADTSDVNGLNWIFENGIVGNASSDMKNGTKAARLRHQTAQTARLELIDNLTNISALSFVYARSNFSGDTTGVSPMFTVSYSTDDGTTWTAIDTIDLAGVSTLTTASYTLSIVGDARIRFQTISGDDGKRFNIDDISITSSSPTALNILTKSPASSDIPLSTTDLVVKFDKPISVGTGNVYLYNMAGGTPQTFTPADITVADSTATITGMTLENNADYFVGMDAGIFYETGSPANTNNEITDEDTFVWYFYTVDTTPAPIATSLATSFEDCLSDDMAPFTQYSVIGSKTWLCSDFGNGDSTAVYMSGFAGGAQASEDWLITTSRLDFSAMNIPTLSFYNKKRFTGDVVMSLRVSEDYTGFGNPNDATWTEVMTIAEPTGDNTWSQVTDIDLSDYKTTPFFLAFVYECGDTSSTYEYTLDDVLVENVTGIFTPTTNNTNLSVLGNPTTSHIKLLLKSDMNTDYTVSIFDLNGRTIFTNNYSTTKGDNYINLTNINLTSGMYFIKAYNANGKVGTAKAVVK